MGWTQVWLGDAKSNLRRLDLKEQTRICTAIEGFARGASVSGEPPGHLQVGKWWVGLVFEKGAKYTNDDGEDDDGDVVWVMRLHTPDPSGEDDVLPEDDD
jgi:hypothetical protein